MIKTASYSRVTDFEKCAFRAELKYVRKEIEPQRPLKPGQTEQANDRGTRIHEDGELFVKGERAELTPELKYFSDEFSKLREMYQSGLVSLEGEWGFDSAWQPTEYYGDNIWLRVKLDSMVRLTPTHAVVIDYKTGRRDGNEIKHNDQVQLYQIATLQRYPEIEEVTAELWYTDQDELVTSHGTRDKIMKHFKRFNDRFTKLTSATAFPPNPNTFTCRFCLYGPKGSGVCTVGV
jgi:PD-(D/E)XK nuclease superfamily protein